ncbi:hypothetical protein ACF9IK_29180 [Kitasatospora hibisci]|uniref:hypothetical protein n=1 Tax=Kitasatospora hibisci TaxID=3369522 RepID=UPI0037544B48
MTARTILSKLHGRTAAGVPRWALWAAYAVPLTTTPSCIWRIAGVAGGAPLLEHRAAPPEGHGPVIFEGPQYVVALSVLSEVLAFLSFGLIARWGEVWPRWVPVLRGRRVPIKAAVVPAGIGATLLLIFPYGLLMSALGLMINGNPDGTVTHGWQTVVFWVAYGPLAAWGPLVGALTVQYYRRRRATEAAAATAATEAAAIPAGTPAAAPAEAWRGEAAVAR